MITLDEKYTQVCETPSDINEHLPTLYTYSKECTSILELGVRSAVSTFAFLKGLSDNNSTEKRLISCDTNNITDHLNVTYINTFTKQYNIDYTFLLKNDLHIDIPNEISEVDITFIDTWHVYGHLRRELQKFAPITKKYIVMHDTELDKESGETIRSGWNAQHQSRESGIPVEEILRGLEPAIDEFLGANPEWVRYETFTHNNGLTILKRN
jgi:hypothetical protein